ncbi:MAG: PspC domain-containing protein, partial [Flavitalea sp.]
DAGSTPPPLSSQQAYSQTQQTTAGRGSLYRNADDKILGGVCSGLANFFKIDPVVLRIAFVLLIGVLFWVYILLWIIVPSKSVQSNITKRLFRSSEHKVLGGVAAGIAAYFNIEVWIPRLIFVLPFILALISGGFHAFWWHWDFGFMPRIISGGFGWTLFLTYVVLWISVPVANTSAEKLEMRGEKVDLNSIRNTVKEDLENFKARAEKWGTEVKESASNLGQQASVRAKSFAAEAGPVARRSSNGLAYAIGILFKTFFLFIFAIIAMALFSAFIGILFGSVAFAPLKNFILEGPWQNMLAWLTLFLFFLVPLIAMITWGIRRIMGVRSRHHFIGFTFSILWLVGLFSGIALAVGIARNFSSNSTLQEEQVSIMQPHNKLIVEVEKGDWKKFNRHFFGMDVDDGDLPFFNMNEDSILLNTVKISITKSNDSAFHVYKVRSSRAARSEQAQLLAQGIGFEVEQQNDSTVVLPRGFAINKQDKFRNQRVWVVVEVPVGKKVQFGDGIRSYKWFAIYSKNKGIEVDDYGNESDWDNMYSPDSGGEYLMNDNGRPERVN